MYTQHFGLTTDPFPLAPRLYFVFQSRAYGETMAHLVYGIEQEEAIVLISGGIGTGKTLALQSLLNQLSGPIDPVMVNVTQMNWHELLRYVLLEMGEDLDPDLGIADLVQRLKKTLLARREQGRRVLLIVDEAQHLGTEELEGLRLLMNISPPENICMQLVLVGQPALEATIAQPDLAQLNQRIRVRYRLTPLTRRELEDYIEYRVEIAGSEKKLFAKAALDRIYELSGGVPRVVNILASRAMLAAYVDDASKISRKHVVEEDLPPLSDQDVFTPQSEPAPSLEPVAKSELESTAPPKPKPIPKPIPVARPKPVVKPRPVAKPEPDPIPRPVAKPAAAAPKPVVTPKPVAATPPRPMSVPEPARPVTAPPAPPVVAQESKRRRFVWIAAAAAVALLLGSWGFSALRTDSPPTSSVAASAGIDPATSTTLDPAQSVPAAAAIPEVVVHVATFRDPSRAVAYIELLDGAGATAYADSVTGDGDMVVQVFLGPVADVTEAGTLVNRLSDDGLVAFSRTLVKES